MDSNRAATPIRKKYLFIADVLKKKFRRCKFTNKFLKCQLLYALFNYNMLIVVRPMRSVIVFCLYFACSSVLDLLLHSPFTIFAPLI